MKTSICTLCEGEIKRDGPKPPASCFAIHALRPPECWVHDANPLLAMCGQSQSFRQFRGKVSARRTAMLHALGNAIQSGDAAVREYLASLSPEARFELMRGVVPKLAAFLATVIPTIEGCEIRPASRSVVIPERLPPGLRTQLQAYHDKLQSRFNKLIAKGHDRAPNFVSRIMSTQIRFAEHLLAGGIERWDVVRKRDIVAFLQDNPSVTPDKVMRFMRFVNEHQPFRETRGRPSRSQGGERRNVTPPKTVPPQVLEAFLADVRTTRSDAEYLLAWLVCRMGMMAQPAYALSLDRVRFNDAGRLVIRPARVWVSVPRAIEALFRKLIDEAAPNWRKRLPEQLKGLTFFRHYIPNLDVFTVDVLQGRTRILRASAVFAAMMKGQVDRVTLHQTMGVSMPFLVKLELLLSTDMHRSLDASLVKRRNDHILGKRDD